ncbi:MAG: MMPL family transporter [Deltaproteobacteria bacterium]|nr:MMPL family transporter [Deltaproteobacteria bacterium]
MHQFIYRFHKYILIFTVLLTLIAIILVTQLKLDLNLFSLLPSDNPSVHTFFEITEEIGLQSLLIALVEMPPDCDRKQSEALVDLLAKNFAQSPLIREVEYKSGEKKLSSLFQEFMEYFPLFLKDRGLKSLTIKLSDAEIHRQVCENKKLLMTPFSIAAKELVYGDPLGLRELIEANLTAPSGRQQPIRPFGGYYRTKEGETYFLFIKPKKPPQDITFSKELMAEVRHLEKISLSEKSADLPKKIKISPPPCPPPSRGRMWGGVKISYTGGYPIAVNDEAITKRDIKVTILASFLGVMILFGLSFRTSRILFYVGVPLVISLIWTLGFASLAFHHLNILTCIFSCVLIGLGIDFAIHIVNRYFGQDKVDLDVPHRLQQTFQEAGMGIIIGGITTATAFYSIGISDFRGFKELGILTGTGILFCIVAMVFLLPSLLVCFSSEKGSRRKVAIAGFGLKALLDLVLKYPRALLMVTFVTVCLLAVSGTKINFDDNLKNFRPADDEILRLQDQVTGWLGGSTATVLLVAKGKSEVEVMETNTSIYEALEELKGSGMVAGTRSTSKYFLPPGQQRKNIEFIRQHADVFDIKRIKRTFNEALDKNGFQVSDLYDGYFESLSRAFSAEKILLPSSFQQTELDKLLKMFAFRKDGYFKAVTYISPSGDLWSHADTTRFKEMIIRKLEEKGIKEDRYDLTGANLLTGDLKELIIKNLKSSLWLAGLSIVVVLLIYYRSLKLLVLSTLPLTIGLATLSGMMVIFRFDFNFFNLIVVPMIVGIGIDDGVHFTNTFRRLNHFDMSKGMSQTGRAVVLTSLTTMVGFGSIALSHYPGLKSMGYVAIIGISACLFASVIVLPAIFAIIRHSE